MVAAMSDAERLAEAVSIISVFLHHTDLTAHDDYCCCRRCRAWAFRALVTRPVAKGAADTKGGT